VKLATLAAVARRALAEQSAGDTLAPKRLRAYVLARLPAIAEAFGRKLTRETFDAIPVEQLPRELLVACTDRRVRRIAAARARDVAARLQAARRRIGGPASVRAYRGWETRRERDEQVAVNVPDELLPLWERIHSCIEGETPHARFERFMEYAEEHPDESVAAMQEAADRKVDRMTRGAA
jgi:hypothetical protein